MTKSNLPEPGQLLKAIRDEQELPIIYAAMERTIWQSFAVDKSRATILLPTHSSPTQSAIAERFTICVDYLVIARCEYGFSLDRALAKMGHYLRCKLDQIPVDLKQWKERGYFADDGE